MFHTKIQIEIESKASSSIQINERIPISTLDHLATSKGWTMEQTKETPQFIDLAKAKA